MLCTSKNENIILKSSQKFWLIGQLKDAQLIENCNRKPIASKLCKRDKAKLEIFLRFLAMACLKLTTRKHLTRLAQRSNSQCPSRLSFLRREILKQKLS